MKSLYEILVPVCYQEGSVIPMEHHGIFDAEVRKISGGMTILRSAIGEWGETRERVIPVRFMAYESEVHSLMIFAHRHYKQKAIMAYKLSSDIMIYEGSI